MSPENSRPPEVKATERQRPQSNSSTKLNPLNTPNFLTESLQLKDKVAVVTGGSRGIGRAAVECFAGLGANVVVNYVTDSGAASAAVSEAEATGVGAMAVKADVATCEGADLLIGSAVERFG